MTTFAENILIRFRNYLDEDSEILLNEINDPGELRNPLDVDQEDRKRFASLLVSVATHPVGLKASVSPFNCDQEHMLAYLMGMFNFRQKELERMLNEIKGSPKSPPTLTKKHSWCPEIKFRVGPPVFNERSQEYLDNLTVRVYIFRERPMQDKKRKNSNSAEPSPTSGSPVYSSFLEILTRAKFDRSTLVRPANEKHLELKFMSDHQDGSYRAVLVKTNDQKLGYTDERDICINVRRCYAECESAYIMKLEYWLSNKVANIGKFRRLIDFGVYCNAICPFTPDKPSAYQSENKVFYGYIDINLSQIPSYATKRSYPLLSIRGRQVSSSEICIEFRNSRFISPSDGNYNQLPALEKAHTNTGQDEDNFIVNHLRLYANCLIYQLSLLKLGELIKSDDLVRLTSNITFDNLIYLPAHTLINQHRLQSNLRLLEDQSLRRSAILLLLVKLADGFKSSKSNPLKLVILLLISIAQHEYLVAHRLFDNKTMQEVEIFDEELSSDNSRESILEIEQFAIVEFFKKFVSSERLSGEWLKNLPTTKLDLGRAMTLSSLRFVKCVLEHYKTNKLVNLEQRHNVLKLEAQAEKLLADVITSDIKSKLHNLLAVSDTTSGQPTQVRSRVNFRSKRREKSKNRNRMGPGSYTTWQQIADYTQRIDHDLSLHWSKKGFGCLALDSSKLLETTSSTKGSEGARSLISTIKAKLNRYLSGQSA